MTRSRAVWALAGSMVLVTVVLWGLASAQPADDGNSKTLSFSGSCTEGAAWEEDIALEDSGILSAEFVLAWTDDVSGSDPDTLELSTVNGEMDPKSASANSGTVTLGWTEEGLSSDWHASVTCVSIGDETGPGGFITITDDTGNPFTLEMTYTFGEGGMGGGMGGPPANVMAVLSSPVFWAHLSLMIASTYLFLVTGLVAGVYLAGQKRLSTMKSNTLRLFTTLKPTIALAIVVLIAFFLAAVPLGMAVADMMYGKPWTGFPVFWEPDMFLFTNADNVSLIVLILWAIPLWLNRAEIMHHPLFRKLFGRSKWLMDRAERAPAPRLGPREMALCYMFMGLLVFLVFKVQPHGDGG